MTAGSTEGMASIGNGAEHKAQSAKPTMATFVLAKSLTRVFTNSKFSSFFSLSRQQQVT